MEKTIKTYEAEINFRGYSKKGRRALLTMAAVLLVAFALIAPGCAKEADTDKGSKTTTTALAKPTDKASGDGKIVEPAPKPVLGNVVGSDLDITAYVTEYFEAYKKKEWQKAYDLLPQANRDTQTLAEFTSRRAGAEITGYKVGNPVASGDQARIMVVYSIVQYGDWASIWSFDKQKDEWLPKSLEVTLTN